MPSTRSAFASPAARSLTAWAIVHKGKHAGNVLTYRADSGGVTATVSLWAGPWARPALTGALHGHATGYGYDKGSAAIADCVGGSGPLSQVAGRGMSTVRAAFEAAGYEVFQVLS